MLCLPKGSGEWRGSGEGGEGGGGGGEEGLTQNLSEVCVECPNFGHWR